MKAPLTFGEGTDREWYIHDADENWVAEAVPNGPGEAEEAARRIVACVNACAGVPIEVLEAAPSISGVIIGIEAQRDELLAAMESVERYVHDDFVAAGIGQLIARVKGCNVELAGDAQLHRRASRERSERG